LCDLAKHFSSNDIINEIVTAINILRQSPFRDSLYDLSYRMNGAVGNGSKLLTNGGSKLIRGSTACDPSDRQSATDTCLTSDGLLLALILSLSLSFRRSRPCSPFHRITPSVVVKLSD